MTNEKIQKPKLFKTENEKRKMRENTSLIIQSHQTIHIYAYTQFITKTMQWLYYFISRIVLVSSFFRNKRTKLDDYIKLAITYETDSRKTQITINAPQTATDNTFLFSIKSNII